MGKVTYLNYTQALELVEAFMKNTGIRRYCEHKCLGDCCGTCYKQSNACYKNEGRRLACSMYLCRDLFELIFPHDSVQSKYKLLCRYVKKAIIEARYQTDGKDHENVYYVPYSKEQMNAFRIKKSLFTKLMPTNAAIYQISETVLTLESLANKAIRATRKKRIKRE